MYRTVTALAVALLLLLSMSVPAWAQTRVQLRYWSTNAEVNNSGLSFPATSNMWGFSLRRDIGDWGVSFNFDRGSNNFLTAAADQYNLFWNVNLHRNFPIQTNGRASLFAGFGSASHEHPSTPLYSRQTGFRIGADATVDVRSDWYVTGAIGVMFGTAEQLNYYGGGIFTTNSTVVDWRAGVGRSFGMWGVEGGYRRIQWTFNPTIASCTGPCNANWGGWYVGLNLTQP